MMARMRPQKNGVDREPLSANHPAMAEWMLATAYYILISDVDSRAPAPKKMPKTVRRSDNQNCTIAVELPIDDSFFIAQRTFDAYHLCLGCETVLSKRREEQEQSFVVNLEVFEAWNHASHSSIEKSILYQFQHQHVGNTFYRVEEEAYSESSTEGCTSDHPFRRPCLEPYGGELIFVL